MKPEFLESAEFYNRRYHNFSSRVIVPMSLLLVFLLGFATFAEKEMSLSTRATVEPSRILAHIQSTSNNRILVNHWKKISWSRRGIFWSISRRAEGVQAEAYASQLDMLKDQKSNWSICRRACKKGRTTFQRRINLATKPPFATTISLSTGSLRASTSQQNETIASQNAAASQTQVEIGNLISQTEAKIRELPDS